MASAELRPEIAALLEGRGAVTLTEWQGPAAEVAWTRMLHVPAASHEIPVRLYRPLQTLSPMPPLVVFFHGGGWQRGNLALYDKPCRLLAHSTGCPVAAVDYRLAPRHRFPAALDDGLVALRALAARAGEWDADPQRIVLAGDSAGGNLTAALCLRLLALGETPVAHQLLVYPPLDARMREPSHAAFANGPLITSEGLRADYAAYARDGADLDDPLLSPLRAPSLRGLPSATIVTAGIDPVRDDGERYADRLRDAGVPVALHRIEGVPHMAFHMAGASAHCRAIYMLCGDALRKRFGSG